MPGLTFKGLEGASGIALNDINARAKAVSGMDLDDAVFHYTSAEGLLGILSSGQLWSTAHVATNDVSEFKYGRGVLEELVKKHSFDGENQKRVDAALRALELDFDEAAASFEDHVAFVMDHFITVYMSSFCRARSKKDYLDGLLSQWRGYGGTGGYAIQFSRTKLQEWIEGMGPEGISYGLHPVYYQSDNPVRPLLGDLAEGVSAMFTEYLENWTNIKDTPFFVRKAESGRAAMYNVFMAMNEAGEVIKMYFGYLASTKNPSFEEEAEVRLSVYFLRNSNPQSVNCFIRNGAFVPYVATPEGAAEKLLAAISWIVVGPGAGADAKERGLKHYLRARKLDNIRVRRSEIPLN